MVGRNQGKHCGRQKCVCWCLRCSNIQTDVPESAVDCCFIGIHVPTRRGSLTGYKIRTTVPILGVHDSVDRAN